MPVIPIYYGDPQVMNITTSPSFIRVMDFESPKSLAHYLLYLDSHPDEYAKYHTWRLNPASISKDYLKSLQKDVPGPKEILVNLDHRNSLYHSPRRAVCCRLCNAEYVHDKIEERKRKLSRGELILVHQAWDHEKIRQQFYPRADNHSKTRSPTIIS